MGGACSSDGEGRGEYRLLVWKPKGERTLGRTRRRWKNNIKMNLQEVECGECGNEPSGSIKCGGFLD
jgi:hypothetical protein